MESIKLQVKISKASHPDLFQFLVDAGAYYRGRRLVSLASLAMSGGGAGMGLEQVVIESGRSNTPTDANTKPKRKTRNHHPESEPTNPNPIAATDSEEAPATESPRYSISDDATDEIWDMLGLFQ